MRPKRKERGVSDSPNAKLLDEINLSNAWFRAKKTRPLWVRCSDQDVTVQTLEGRETARAGEYLCRGEVGDIWPQRAESLEAKYAATEIVDAGGWRKYLPRPDDEGVLAAEIDHAFAIESRWGSIQGKPGDYVVKHYRDKDVPYPEDVWIVDAGRFQATYQRVDAPEHE